MMHTLDAALAYRTRGWSVIPIKPLSKRPLVRWLEYASRLPTEAQIRQWWDFWPDASVAIITGAVSRLVIADFDGAAGRDTFKALVRDGRLPATPTCISGRAAGGVHLYFRLPNGLRLQNRAGGRPGLDLKAEHGYALAPPSVHASGRPYRWGPGRGADVTVAPASDWLLALASEVPAVAPQAMGGLTPENPSERGVLEGGRHIWLWRWCRGRVLVSDTGHIERRAQMMNERICQPPLPQAEVDEIVRSALNQRDRSGYVRVAG